MTDLFVGTVVKHKRGKFTADLARHGDEILVARGGQGGVSNPCLLYLSDISLMLALNSPFCTKYCRGVKHPLQC